MKTQPKFDETKSYGETHSIGATSVRQFEQDGHLFDGVTREYIGNVPETAPKVESPHKFDPKRPYGTIRDTNDCTIRYVQDGMYFGHDGLYVKDEE
jgi:hypothetical protein